MANRRKELSPKDLAALRLRINVWRGGRSGRGPMPVEIWDSAVVLARMYGLCKIARAVGLDYKSLRSKEAKGMEKPGLMKPAFVQLPATVVSKWLGVPRPEPGSKSPPPTGHNYGSTWKPDEAWRLRGS